MRLMRTASSPSLISISAMPDSSSSSISFLIFRMSMRGGLPRMSWIQRESGRTRQPLERGAHGELVAEGTEPQHAADRDIREIGMPAKGLAGVGVRQMYFDE